MLMVIFGAGASHDCVPGIINNPAPGSTLPLAVDLFAPEPDFTAIAHEIPQCVPIVSRLREVLEPGDDKTIEARLADLKAREESDPILKRQLAALRFYLVGIIRKRTADIKRDQVQFNNYSTLLNKIHDWRQASGEEVMLVTFNYDTLLDEAFQGHLGNINLSSNLRDEVTAQNTDEPAFNLPPQAQMIMYPDWKLLKLHGSVTRSRKVCEPGRQGEFASARDQAIAKADVLDFSSADIIDRYADEEPIKELKNDLYMPALAVPTNTKDSFECSPGEQQIFENAIPKVDALLIIGWKAQEQHALEMLAELPPHVRIGIVDYDEENNTGEPPIGGDEGAALVWRNLRDAVSCDGMPERSDRGFSGFLSSGQVTDWLEGRRWRHDPDVDRVEIRRQQR